MISVQEVGICIVLYMHCIFLYIFFYTFVNPLLPDEDKTVIVAVERDDHDADDTKLKSPSKTGSSLALAV